MISTLVNSEGVMNPEFEKMIERFKKREIHLSASKLKGLTNPLNFSTNLMKVKSGAGLSFGSLVDDFITNEDKMNKKYLISEETLSEGNQSLVVDMVLSVCGKRSKEEEIEAEVERAFNAVYTNKNSKTLAFLVHYCKTVISGKMIVKQEIWDEANAVAINLKTEESVKRVLDNADSTQTKLMFKYRGWKFIGFLDVFSMGDWYDFKFSSRLNPDYLERTILNFGYDVQFGVYGIGLREAGMSENPKGHFIFFDDKGNIINREFAQDFQSYAEKKVDMYITRLEWMIKDDAWLKSYDYFFPNKKIHKPRWLNLEYGSEKFVGK